MVPVQPRHPASWDFYLYGNFYGGNRMHLLAQMSKNTMLFKDSEHNCLKTQCFLRIPSVNFKGALKGPFLKGRGDAAVTTTTISILFKGALKGACLRFPVALRMHRCKRTLTAHHLRAQMSKNTMLFKDRERELAHVCAITCAYVR